MHVGRVRAGKRGNVGGKNTKACAYGTCFSVNAPSGWIISRRFRADRPGGAEMSLRLAGLKSVCTRYNYPIRVRSDKQHRCLDTHAHPHCVHAPALRHVTCGDPLRISDSGATSPVRGSRTTTRSSAHNRHNPYARTHLPLERSSSTVRNAHRHRHTPTHIRRAYTASTPTRCDDDATNGITRALKRLHLPLVFVFGVCLGLGAGRSVTDPRTGHRNVGVRVCGCAGVLC